MHADEALLGGYAEAQREAVVAGAAMDVHAIGPTRPEAVVGDLVAEEAEERPRHTEAEEANLPAMRVAGEDEVPLSWREVPERAGIVQENDTRLARLTRVLLADASEPRRTITEREVHPDDLDVTGLGLDLVRVVDEERDAVASERARNDLGRLVIVVSLAREDPARKRA